MKKLTFIILMILSLVSCKKSKPTSCELDSCDPKRTTIYTASLWIGYLGYYNDIRKWAINYQIPNTIDGVRTCIICRDIPDSLKSIGRQVTFSGDLKESCNNPIPQLGHQEIYYINPTILK